MMHACISTASGRCRTLLQFPDRNLSSFLFSGKYVCSPTLFGLFFDDLYSQLQSDCPSAGVECRGTRSPSLFYADDVALLSASAQGLQQLLDSTQSFCAANGLTISIPKTEVVVFGGGHHHCVWKVVSI